MLDKFVDLIQLTFVSTHDQFAHISPKQEPIESTFIVYISLYAVTQQNLLWLSFLCSEMFLLNLVDLIHEVLEHG